MKVSTELAKGLFGPFAVPGLLWNLYPPIPPPAAVPGTLEQRPICVDEESPPLRAAAGAAAGQLPAGSPQ